MRLLAALLVVAGLAAVASPAGAQEEPAPPPLADEMQRDPCEGADADYQYQYCPGDAIPDNAPSAGADEPAAAPPQVRPLATQTLARTGAETRFLVVAGLGLLFAGAGLRLRLDG